MKNHMSPSDRIRSIFRFQPVDRLPVMEWATWWNKTLERWHAEGLPVSLTDQEEIRRYFGLDVYRQAWMRSVHHDIPKPALHGAGRFGDFRDPRDAYAALRPFLFRIDSDWPFHPAQWKSWADERDQGMCGLWISLDGFFWLPRTLFGIENHFYAFYDYPELMHEINRENAEWMIRLIHRVCQVATPDFMTFAEDMSYNHGPMLSRQLFDEFMLPYYRRVVPVLEQYGIIPIVDSDGDITTAIPWFEQAGIPGILPLERQAGVDLAIIRHNHPRFLALGHFDKLVMHQDDATLEAEFQRHLPVARQGGFVPSCDHQTPPAVSIEQYRRYVRRLRQFAIEAAPG